MKKTSLYIASIGLAAIALGACDDDFERPPMIVPSSTWEANTTIKQFKEDYWSTVETTPVTVGLNADGDSIIIKGRVCSSDETGNIFKYLMIQQDGDAIALSLDFYDIYETYKFGQEVYVNVTGLTIGGYSGLMCIGYGSDDRGRVARAPETTFASHAQTDGLPNTALVDTVTTTIADVNTYKSTTEGLMKWQSQLVRFDDVRFEDAGEGFTTGNATTDRYIVDDAGNRIDVRNSSYADFKDEILPYGTGSVVGILSYYGTNWQILLNDAEGCIGFNGVASPVFSPAAGTVLPGTEVTISCPTEGATIHYTTDGSQPTITSTEYTGPITINETTTIMAIATKDGLDASPVVTARFTVSDNVVPDGDGSEANPYNVAQIIALNPTSTTEAVESGVWVKGYVVGYIPTGGESTVISGTVFSAEGAAASNLVIAPTAEETDYNNCIALQLSSGTAARTALNLKDNPGNLGKEVEVKGDVMKYCGGPGLKNLTDYKIDGDSGGDDDNPDVPSEGATFKLASSITSGKSYLIVADGKMGVSFGDKTYGYMSVADATISGDEISAETSNAWTFTAVDGGYTIQEATGRYVYMTGTYNSFNLSDTLPSSGHVWTVSFSNGQATITNVEMNKSIQYDSQYGSYGSYPDSRGTLPSLYEKVD